MQIIECTSDIKDRRTDINRPRCTLLLYQQLDEMILACTAIAGSPLVRTARLCLLHRGQLDTYEVAHTIVRTRCYTYRKEGIEYSVYDDYELFHLNRNVEQRYDLYSTKPVKAPDALVSDSFDKKGSARANATTQCSLDKSLDRPAPPPA